MQVEIRLANVSDLDRAADVLGHAFADYPWTRWTVDPDDHQRRITALQRMALEHYGLTFGRVWVATVDVTIHSVAVWMDSAVAVPSSTHELLYSKVAELEGSRHAAASAAERRVRSLRPTSRHGYLASIGTNPSMQGRGLASALLDRLLEVADATNIPSYLETSSESNVAFYESHGFEIVEHIRIRGGGPDVWAMLRK